jgi:hypothetical protein
VGGAALTAAAIAACDSRDAHPCPRSSPGCMVSAPRTAATTRSLPDRACREAVPDRRRHRARQATGRCRRSAPLSARLLGDRLGCDLGRAATIRGTCHAHAGTVPRPQRPAFSSTASRRRVARGTPRRSDSASSVRMVDCGALTVVRRSCVMMLDASITMRDLHVGHDHLDWPHPGRTRRRGP